MKRRALIALCLVVVACRDSNEGTERSATALSVRTATPPSLPDTASGVIPFSAPPFGSACLAGDPASGARWSLARLAAESPALQMTAIEEMSSRDSARLAARLARVADAIPFDTTRADFRGLTMVVQAAWRVVVVPGETLFAARTVRRLPIESAPLEETTRFVAVPTAQPGARDPLAIRWSIREVGPEESADPSDLAAALLLRARPALVFVRTAEDTARVELLLRGDSAWSIGWRGGVPRCPVR